MFITRECDYAARVLRALSGETRLSVNEICEKESITAPFAYKILKKLQKAGIVKGYRGVHGGYAMNKSLGELTLFDVYKAIDPDLFIIECMASGYECPTDGKGDHLPCYMHRELCEIQQGVWEMLKRKSLQEVLMPEMLYAKKLVRLHKGVSGWLFLCLLVIFVCDNIQKSK